MIKATAVDSLTNFQKNSKAFVGKLEASKEPLVLTVNGKAKLVVQDAEAYQTLLDKVQATEDLEAIRQGLKESLEGKGRPAEEFFAEFEAKNEL
ncbi:MAG: type II toxin-antitoxin system Phd/YefM family antitoxin [Fimbriimonadaceae bacterium]|nr:type II toxin-antitoxin system Phd/YefM family antitoxin [Fimbriimonadaceae bacterium]